jgi:hypothetical protein
MGTEKNKYTTRGESAKLLNQIITEDLSRLAMRAGMSPATFWLKWREHKEESNKS